MGAGTAAAEIDAAVDDVAGVVDDEEAVAVDCAGDGAARGGGGATMGGGRAGRTEGDGAATGGGVTIGGASGATAEGGATGGAGVEGTAGAKVGGWASGDEIAGVVGVDEIDEVLVEMTDEVEDEVGQTDEPADTEGEDVSEDDGVTTVSKGGGAGTMRGNKGPYRGAGDADLDEAALATRDEEGESSSGLDTNKEVG